MMDKEKLTELLFTNELREKFFRECTSPDPDKRGLRKVNLTSHNLFEWFKNNV